jgi:hypothetical protein
MTFTCRSLLAAGCLLLLPAIVYTTVEPSVRVPAKLGIVVADQKLAADSLTFSTTASNSGPQTLLGDWIQVRYQLDGAWKTNSFGGMPSTIAWLSPGESRRSKLHVPRHTTRFQVTYVYQVAGPRTSIACRLLKYNWMTRLDKVVGPALDLLPNRDGNYVHFWSRLNEVESNVD